jgi:diacylglycerol kinase family enzyme
MKESKAYHIYINQNAGSVKSIGLDKIRDILSRHSIEVAELNILPPEELFLKLENDTHNNPILVGGGDGTIKQAATILMKKKQAFGILPFGTMNLLAGDLNIPDNFQKALDCYAGKTNDKKIDVAYANEELFLCNAALGAIPDSSKFREENRTQNDIMLAPKMLHFFMGRLQKRKRTTYKINFDKNPPQKVKSPSLVISNNQYQNSADGLGPRLKRRSLQGGMLALYSVAPLSLFEMIRIVLKLGFGQWRQDPKIKEWLTSSLIINTDNEYEDITVDGEVRRMKTPLAFDIKSAALTVIIPKENTA